MKPFSISVPVWHWNSSVASSNFSTFLLFRSVVPLTNIFPRQLLTEKLKRKVWWCFISLSVSLPVYSELKAHLASCYFEIMHVVHVLPEEILFPGLFHVYPIALLPPTIASGLWHLYLYFCFYLFFLFLFVLLFILFIHKFLPIVQRAIVIFSCKATEISALSDIPALSVWSQEGLGWP